MQLTATTADVENWVLFTSLTTLRRFFDEFTIVEDNLNMDKAMISVKFLHFCKLVKTKKNRKWKIVSFDLRGVINLLKNH